MQTLLPINEFIKEARRQGASFGSGDPKVHLAYLTKLGILPNATKRKINGELQGCYDQELIMKVLEVQELKDKGMTYSQIAKSVDNKSLKVMEPTPLSLFNPNTSNFILHMKPSNFAYLALGLVIGVLVSTLNTSGLNAMNQTPSLSLGQPIEIKNQTGEPELYMIAVPKQNLDKLGKTNINSLIQN